MNTPQLETPRLILRKFTGEDIEALYLILKDEEVNTFLPWYPLKSIGEARVFFEKRYGADYTKPQAYAYAICLKSDNYPIGYIKVDMDESHDFGYGLRKEFWHQGIVTDVYKRQEFMRVTYNPEAPSPLIVNEIKYYMALSALKKMLADSVITSENYKKATVAIAERYRVLRYDI